MSHAQDLLSVFFRFVERLKLSRSEEAGLQHGKLPDSIAEEKSNRYPYETTDCLQGVLRCRQSGDNISIAAF